MEHTLRRVNATHETVSPTSQGAVTCGLESCYIQHVLWVVPDLRPSIFPAFSS